MSSPRLAHRVTTVLAAALLVAVLVPASALAASGRRSYNGLALTPPMGYND